MLKLNLLKEAEIGPKARARAPIERKIPRMTPFWSGGPLDDITVVRHGTTIAEEYA